MTHSENREFIAIGYIKANTKKAYIAIHSVRNAGVKVKIMRDIDLFEGLPEPINQRQVVSLAFSRDNKSIAVVINGPDWKVLVYRWDVKTATGSTCKLICKQDFNKHEIYKVTFHPNDSTTVMLSGPGLLQIYHLHNEIMDPSEFTFQDLHQPLNQLIFTDHVWTEES